MFFIRKDQRLALEWFLYSQDVYSYDYIDSSDLSTKIFVKRSVNPQAFHSKNNFTSDDLKIALLYGQRSSPSIGVNARFAEKETLEYLYKLGFEKIIDHNDQSMVHEKWEKHVFSSPTDLKAIFDGKIFQFDVKCKINPKHDFLDHGLKNLTRDEGIFFVRTNGKLENLKYYPVGYLLPEQLCELFNIDSEFQSRIPGYFFFNNSPEALREYCQSCDYFFAPHLMYEIEKQLVERGVMYKCNQREYHAILKFIECSHNLDCEKWANRVHKILNHRAKEKIIVKKNHKIFPKKRAA